VIVSDARYQRQVYLCVAVSLIPSTSSSKLTPKTLFLTMPPILPILVLLSLAVSCALAHPGHSVAEEAAERGEWLQSRQPRSVRSCATNLRQRGLFEASLARRRQLVRHARMKRSLTDKQLVGRDFSSALNTSHTSNLSVTLGADEQLLFADDSSCLLAPEVTQGPYYIDGEIMRSDTTEDQAGVPLFLDVQIVDTSTCEPVPAVYMEIWHCSK
jgi:hypothetical protein